MYSSFRVQFRNLLDHLTLSKCNTFGKCCHVAHLIPMWFCIYRTHCSSKINYFCVCCSSNKFSNLSVTKCSSEDPDQDIRTLVEKYSKNLESEPRLKLLLPRIISTFGSNKSVKEVMKELENHQLSGDSLGEHQSNVLFSS